MYENLLIPAAAVLLGLQFRIPLQIGCLSLAECLVLSGRGLCIG